MAKSKHNLPIFGVDVATGFIIGALAAAPSNTLTVRQIKQFIFRRWESLQAYYAVALAAIEKLKEGGVVTVTSHDSVSEADVVRLRSK